MLIASVLLAACGWFVATASASSTGTVKKSIWGPAQIDGVSQFPIYRDLGVGLYQTSLLWAEVARARPANPRDPDDPAYTWPAELGEAIDQAVAYRIKVSVMLITAPTWANGGRASNWAPRRPSDFADFAVAAARRYPAVHHWMIWGEPSRGENFMPLEHETRGRKLSRRQAAAPRRYARILDAAYGSLKRLSRRNRVIGGNTFTTGDISPLNWIRHMRLPNGKPPRLDMYGHNPFTARKPDLRAGPLVPGFADFSDLDTLARWVDRYLVYGRGRSRPKLFLSEFFLPTDHPNHEFNFYVSRKLQSQWLAAAMRITFGWSRIYTLGWFGLYDDPPNAAGDEVNRGLLDWQGNKKPAYRVFKLAR